MDIQTLYDLFFGQQKAVQANVKVVTKDPSEETKMKSAL